MARGGVDRVIRFKARYDLWEDTEGGRSCDVALTNEPTIGGYAAKPDDACLSQYALPWCCGRDGNNGAVDKSCTPKAIEDIFAWFITPNDDLVLAVATRQPVFRFPRMEDGRYYFRRDEERLQALLFTPPDDRD